jgi:hypothetical protein
VIVAAPANLAVATGREQRIVVEREIVVAPASSVAEGIEAALAAAAAPFRGLEVGEARREAPASGEARADPAVEEAEDLAEAVEVEAAEAVEVVEVAAAAAAGRDANKRFQVSGVG